MVNFVSICFSGLESVSFSAWVKSYFLFHFHDEESVSFQFSCVNVKLILKQLFSATLNSSSISTVLDQCFNQSFSGFEGFLFVAE